MKKKIILVALVLALVFPNFALADIADNLKGKILLQVEGDGQAWYVVPGTQERAYLGRPADAFRIMRELGIGVSEKDYNFWGDKAPEKLSGNIILRVEAKGEAYYVNPSNLEMKYLGRPADAFKVMRELGLGISDENLEKVSVMEKYKEDIEADVYLSDKFKTDIEAIVEKQNIYKWNFLVTLRNGPLFQGELYKEERESIEEVTLESLLLDESNILTKEEITEQIEETYGEIENLKIAIDNYEKTYGFNNESEKEVLAYLNKLINQYETELTPYIENIKEIIYFYFDFTTETNQLVETKNLDRKQLVLKLENNLKEEWEVSLLYTFYLLGIYVEETLQLNDEYYDEIYYLFDDFEGDPTEIKEIF